MDVHETTCGLVEMLGFAVDIFRPELPRQDRYARACGGRPWELWKRQVPRQHCGRLQRGAHAAVRAPMRSAKGFGGQYGMGAPSPSGIGW
jgi:hypothetical protein